MPSAHGQKSMRKGNHGASLVYSFLVQFLRATKERVLTKLNFAQSIMSSFSPGTTQVHPEIFLHLSICLSFTRFFRWRPY